MNKRILCPKHEERTPSCILYPDGYHCFGCGARGSLAELGLIERGCPAHVDKEDLGASLKYILDLPRGVVRGHIFPVDEDAYYVVWPDLDYYKKRYFNPFGPKYLGTAGHKKPWFWARREGISLIIVEGEINALSIASSCPEMAVVSPGGVGDFSANRIKKHLQVLVQYSTITIVADADAPGAKAIIEMYGELAGRVPTVKTLLMPVDANELLVTRGKEAVRKEIQRAVGGNLATSA